MKASKIKPVLAKLISYQPAYIAWHGSLSWSIEGRGMGILVDEAGKRYFIFGNELGGGLYGEDADRRFIQVGRHYLIHSVWKKPKDETHTPFFMGFDLRASKVTLQNGTSPSERNKLKNTARIRKLGKLSPEQKNAKAEMEQVIAVVLRKINPKHVSDKVRQMSLSLEVYKNRGELPEKITVTAARKFLRQTGYEV